MMTLRIDRHKHTQTHTHTHTYIHTHTHCRTENTLGGALRHKEGGHAGRATRHPRSTGNCTALIGGHTLPPSPPSSLPPSLSPEACGQAPTCAGVEALAAREETHGLVELQVAEERESVGAQQRGHLGCTPHQCTPHRRTAHHCCMSQLASLHITAFHSASCTSTQQHWHLGRHRRVRRRQLLRHATVLSSSCCCCCCC